MEFIEQFCAVVLWATLVVGGLWLLSYTMQLIFGTPESWLAGIRQIVLLGGLIWCLERARRFWLLVIEADPDEPTFRVARTGPLLLGMNRSGKDRVPLMGETFDADDLSLWQRLPFVNVRNVTIGGVSIRNISEDDYEHLQAIHAYVNATDRRVDKTMLDVADSLERIENLTKALGREQRKTNELLEKQCDLLSRLLFRQASTERVIRLGPDQAISSSSRPTDPK